MKRYFLLALFGLVSENTLGQSLDVTAVRHAQRSAYAIADATNGCPVIGTDVLGWPGSIVRKCVYVEGPTHNKLTGIAFLIDVKPEAIASWIETSCARLLPGYSACFDTVLKCGQENSGMMFPISGNVMENMNPKTWKNYFFRNGMTVAIDGEANGSTLQIPIEKQEAFASSPDNAIVSIPLASPDFGARCHASLQRDSLTPKRRPSWTARQRARSGLI
jgi:hypothetical protein